MSDTAVTAGTKIRDAVDRDFRAIQRIYSDAVKTGLGSFEEVPPDTAEMARRRTAVIERGLPYLVAEIDGRVRGFAYAAPYRPRSAYRFTLEDSVYVADAVRGRGIGAALLGAVIARVEALGYRQMIAVIGDTGNAASIGLHARLGFERVGTIRSSGYKHGRWVNSVIMQRQMGPGDTTPPAT
ncbi:MAG: N-acetyltransferase family protein [Rhodospirillales bacterium]|nr:N-acetyltransferase family protein [Rhodospirillales bacterium]